MYLVRISHNPMNSNPKPDCDKHVFQSQNEVSTSLSNTVVMFSVHVDFRCWF